MFSCSSAQSRLPKQDVATWNAMIAGYAQGGGAQDTIELLGQMQVHGRHPDTITLVNILKASSVNGHLVLGRRAHEDAVNFGVETVVPIGNSLIDMYSKCCCLEEAFAVFDSLDRRDVVTWTAMIDGLVNKYEEEGLLFFQSMQDEGVEPNEFTFATIFKACSGLMALHEGNLLHAQVIESGIVSEEAVKNSLVDMYAKCLSVEDAFKLFNQLTTTNLVTWTTMLVACADCGDGKEALALFQHMQERKFEPNSITFVSVLKACSHASAYNHGKLIHQWIIESGFELNKYIGSSLLDVHAKCGSLRDARTVFQHLPNQDFVTWSALVSAFALHYDLQAASKSFEDMQQLGFSSSFTNYTWLLSACNHVGVWDEGCQHSKLVRPEDQLTEHYNFAIDLFGRVGHLNDAEDLLQTMPWQPSRLTWTSLLNNCKTYGNLALAKRCFDCMTSSEQADATGYLLMP